MCIRDRDITNIGAFDTLCKKEYPDVVIHCAAVTAVDNCEANQEIAWKVNTLGSLNVASVCNRHNIRLIALSTDYVFDGFKDRPYNEFDLSLIHILRGPRIPKYGTPASW